MLKFIIFLYCFLITNCSDQSENIKRKGCENLEDNFHLKKNLKKIKREDDSNFQKIPEKDNSKDSSFQQNNFQQQQKKFKKNNIKKEYNSDNSSFQQQQKKGNKKNDYNFQIKRNKNLYFILSEEGGLLIEKGQIKFALLDNLKIDKFQPISYPLKSIIISHNNKNKNNKKYKIEDSFFFKYFNNDQKIILTNIVFYTGQEIFLRKVDNSNFENNFLKVGFKEGFIFLENKVKEQNFEDISLGFQSGDSKTQIENKSEQIDFKTILSIKINLENLNISNENNQNNENNEDKYIIINTDNEEGQIKFQENSILDKINFLNKLKNEIEERNMNINSLKKELENLIDNYEKTKNNLLNNPFQNKEINQEDDKIINIINQKPDLISLLEFTKKIEILQTTFINSEKNLSHLEKILHQEEQNLKTCYNIIDNYLKK